nr:hypothetical protein [Chlorobaculum limnaeum]
MPPECWAKPTWTRSTASSPPAAPDTAGMRILFIHQNFPGQFRYLAPALVARGHEVTAMTMRKDTPAQWQGVRLVHYRVARGSTSGIHPWVSDIESRMIRGEACFRACLKMKAEGFSPDVIGAHPGWGESLFVRQAWPDARLGIYCEFFTSPAAATSTSIPNFRSATGRATPAASG